MNTGFLYNLSSSSSFWPSSPISTRPGMQDRAQQQHQPAHDHLHQHLRQQKIATLLHPTTCKHTPPLVGHCRLTQPAKQRIQHKRVEGGFLSLTTSCVAVLYCIVSRDPQEHHPLVEVQPKLHSERTYVLELCTHRAIL